MTTEQFTKFCKICSANVVDSKGSIRFSYRQLRACLATHSEIGVEELFDKCLQFAGIVPQDSLERTTLLLLLLDIHMTYKLVTRGLITQDESVMDLKSLFAETLITNTEIDSEADNTAKAESGAESEQEELF